MNEKPKRKHIGLAEKLATALSQLLPEDERNRLRRDKVDAKQVISMFEFDHVVFKTWGGEDSWWNLTALPKEVHRKKTAEHDIKVIAKTRRREKKRAELAQKEEPAAELERPKPKWGARPLKSRGFDKSVSRRFDGTLKVRGSR